MEKNRKRKPLTQLTLSESASSSSPSTNKKRRSEQTQLNRAGTVIRMTLKNFMCHSLLEVNFTENISMIIGRNGSGKSAILTALIVGLAGKASVTDRGNSVKSFIKAGQNSGSITIELFNEGPMAYRPSTYGKRITVVRNFTASGSSSYKIKNETGDIVSTKSGEINLMTVSLNIQIDNPICILTQDTSRNFLSSSDPKHKFALFIKATRLDTLKEKYTKSIQNKKKSIAILQEKKENFEKFKADMKEVKFRIDDYQSIVTLQQKQDFLQKELYWSKIRDAEQELENEVSLLNKLEAKCDELKEKCNKKTDKIRDLTDEIRTIEQQISEIKDTVQVQSRPQQDILRTLDGLRQQHSDKRVEKNLLQKSIHSKTQDIEVLQKQIENINENMSKIEKEKMERLRNLVSMEEKMKGVDDHLHTCKNDLYQIKSDLDHKEEEDHNFRNEVGQLDNQIAAKQNNLRLLQNETGNKLLLYGQSMPKVLELIEKNRNRFKHVPIGPLGQYIKLKDKKWAVAVEGFLGPRVLKSFAVDNVKDNQLLLQIFNQCWTDGAKPTIITSKFIMRKHDVSNNLVESPEDCASMYDALQVENPVVLNALVDSNGIESILLIPNDSRAIELLSHRRNVPQNCRQGLTIKGDTYYPDPNYRTYASKYHRAKFLQIDTQEYIKQLQEDIQKLAQQKQNIEKRRQAFSDDIQKKVVRRNELEERIRKLMSTKDQIKKRLEGLRSTAEPEIATAQDLETELKEIQKKLFEENAQLANVNEAIKTVKDLIDENELKYKTMKKSTDSLQDRIEPLAHEIRDKKRKQQEMGQSDEFDKKKVSEYEQRMKGIRAEIVIKQNNLKVKSVGTENFGARPETLRPVTDVVKEVKDIERNINRIKNNNDDVEQLEEKYRFLQIKHNNSDQLIKSVSDDIEEFKLAHVIRSKHCKYTEIYFITYIKHSFKKIIELRQFKGTIKVNVEQQKLDLVVIPQQGSQGAGSTANLSGGERSFSTVAFLYSLWQCMEFPFYFLDEFDVYMDKLNRSKVIDILLHHASSRPHLQFVFLTPQDVSFIDKKVSILKLDDPKRF